MQDQPNLLEKLIKKGDGVVLFNGDKGIANGKPFQPISMGHIGLVVPVDFQEKFGTLTMPIELRSITEVWRDGKRIDQYLEQLELGL